MILRTLASVVLLGLLALNSVLPTTSIGRRGTEMASRVDVESRLAVGRMLPAFSLKSFDGREITRADLLGHRVLLTFERSVDW
jgi:cytochrome oxidase Cu insertion factor (SCO1/SenC/PrrC family)